MLSNLTSIVNATIGARKEEVSKKVYNYESKVRDIEKKLNSGEVDLAKALEMVRGIFSYNLNSEDYRKIEKEVGYNVR